MRQRDFTPDGMMELVCKGGGERMTVTDNNQVGPGSKADAYDKADPGKREGEGGYSPIFHWFKRNTGPIGRLNELLPNIIHFYMTD